MMFELRCLGRMSHLFVRECVRDLPYVVQRLCRGQVVVRPRPVSVRRRQAASLDVRLDAQEIFLDFRSAKVAESEALVQQRSRGHRDLGGKFVEGADEAHLLHGSAEGRVALQCLAEEPRECERCPVEYFLALDEIAVHDSDHVRKRKTVKQHPEPLPEESLVILLIRFRLQMAKHLFLWMKMFD